MTKKYKGNSRVCVCVCVCVCLQDIIEKPEFSGSVDNNKLLDVCVCLVCVSGTSCQEQEVDDRHC